jgi:hypothetical protein
MYNILQVKLEFESFFYFRVFIDNKHVFSELNA